MKRLYVTAALAGFALVIAIAAVVPTHRPPVMAMSPLPYQVVPFNTYVAGIGMIETGRGNVWTDTAVLQVNLRAGKFAANNGAAKPQKPVGSGSRLYLRVDIDENDAWRVRPGTRGVAFVRGNPGVPIPLRFEFIEPYGTPKTSLTGQGTERKDLRVLQVVYSFEPTGSPVYLGQQMDAFIAVER